jgi:CheY-like chemotaxis protein
MLTDLFQVHGYQPVCVADPREALMVARGCHPDLAVIDVGPPGGLPGSDGLEAINRLKHDEGLARIPVIAVSASVRPHEVAVICNSGCDDFLAMPFSVKRMLARVALLLH